MTKQKKLSEEELITHCVKENRYLLAEDRVQFEYGQTYEDVEFFAPRLGDWGMDIYNVVKRRLLITSPDLKKVRAYYDAYIETYRNISGRIPTEIVYRDCLFRNDAFADTPQNIALENCKLDAYKNDLTLRRLTGCDVFLEGTFNAQGQQLLLSNCVFRGRLKIINDKHPSQIDDCSFLKPLVCQKVVIKNCMLTGLEQNGHSCEISSSKIKSANFAHTTNLNINSTTFTQCSLNDAILESAIFTNVTFERSPKILGETCFKSKNVYFQRPIFKDLLSGEALGTFRQLKSMCEDAGYEHGVIDFHALELQTHYNLYLRKNCPSALWPEKFCSLLHKAFTDYGRNITQPLFFILLSIFLGAILFYSSYFFEEKPDLFSFSMGCSFRNSIGPLIFALPDAGRDLCNFIKDSFWLSLLAFIQIATCSVIWFLVIFMIRRRFKL